jgi:hypothetical protein
MKVFHLLLLPILFLCSCKTTVVEVYYLESEPVEWIDTLIVKPDHKHYCNYKNEWVCVESFADTIPIHCRDTIRSATYMGTYKKREYKINWNLKSLKNYE